MLTVSSLSISRGPQDLLRDVSFTVNAGSRAALIGPNGGGKSTLLEAIQGRHPVRTGSVRWTPAGLTVGYLDQSGNDTSADSLAAWLGRAGHLERQVATAAARLAEMPDDAAAEAAYSERTCRIRVTPLQYEAGRSKAILLTRAYTRVPARSPRSAADSRVMRARSRPPPMSTSASA